MNTGLAACAVLSAAALSLALSGCAPAVSSTSMQSPNSSPSAPEAQPTAPSSTPTAAEPVAPQSSAAVDERQATAGLVRPGHPQCDFGAALMHYLATGDNRGHPELDQGLSEYVGVPLPRARSIVDGLIQKCDAALSRQEVAAVAAEASAAAAKAQASADAEAEVEQQASASVSAKQYASLLAAQQQSCAAVGGTVEEHSGTPNDCRILGRHSRDGLACDLLPLSFGDDGVLDPSGVAAMKDGYAGCLP